MREQFVLINKRKEKERSLQTAAWSLFPHAGGFQQHNADLAGLCWSEGAQRCTDASPTTMSHFRPLWSGLGGWPPANWSSPPSLTIPLSFPQLIHFSLSPSLSFTAVPLFSVSIIRFENEGKSVRERAQGEVGRGGERWTCWRGLPFLLHQAHEAAPRVLEAVATTGTSGDWGGGLTLPALIRVTGRLLFSPVTCEVLSKAGS